MKNTMMTMMMMIIGKDEREKKPAVQQEATSTFIQSVCPKEYNIFWSRTRFLHFSTCCAYIDDEDLLRDARSFTCCMYILLTMFFMYVPMFYKKVVVLE